MAKLMDPNYNPTPRDLLNDFFYRQSLELSGDLSAWKLHISEVKNRIQRLKFPIFKTIVKLNSVRISSLLMKMFPNDPYSVKYHDNHWAVPNSLIELRDVNNDFEVLGPFRQMYGLWNMTQDEGRFIFDEATGQVMNIEPVSSCEELFAIAN